MADDKVRNRWLKDAEVYAPEDDWDPSEYYQWFERLTTARNTLKDTYKEVDGEVFKEAFAVCRKYKGNMDKQPETFLETPDRCPKVSNVARIIIRYAIAYNFYVRRTFEDIPEKQTVARAQKHLASLKIGMNDIDVARMLQAAADKVPLKTAVRGLLVEFSKEVIAAAPVVVGWRREINTYDEFTTTIIESITSAKVNGELPKIAELPSLLNAAKNKLSPDLQGRVDEDIIKVLKFLDTEEKLRLFTQSRADPALPQQPNAFNDEAKCLSDAVESSDLDKILSKAVSLEKDKLSWEKTIGPAVTAIRRLGRRSAGKDAAALAKYAQDHLQRPQ